MEFDPDQLTSGQRYKLMTCLIVPRPIALVTTLDANGAVNAAPFSFFNVMGSDPPVVVLGVGNRGENLPKDTAANIRRGGEFVVNVVSEAIAEGMNICATDFPVGVSELPAAGLSAVASHHVKPPGIAESPVNMECREVQTIEIGQNRIIMGQVVHFRVRDDLIDPATFRFRTDALHAVGRMHAPNWYVKADHLFEMPRMTYEQWVRERGV